MKKTGILATTTLAGALLFTGVGATHNAHASEYSESSVTLATPEQWQKTHDSLLNARLNGVGGEGGGFGAVSSYQNSYKEYVDYLFELKKKYPNDYPTPVIPKEGKEYLNGQSTQENTQSTTNNETETNNTTATTTNNNVSTQGNTTQANNNQSTTKALPETGEQSNSGLVTIIASVLLAAGSLLTFRRFSKINK